MHLFVKSMVNDLDLNTTSTIYNLSLWLREQASISLFEGNITPIYDLKRREVAVLEGYARNRATQLHSRSCHNRPYSLSFWNLCWSKKIYQMIVLGSTLWTHFLFGSYLALQGTPHIAVSQTVVEHLTSQRVLVIHADLHCIRVCSRSNWLNNMDATKIGV